MNDVKIRLIEKKLIPDLLELFGENGACGGCFCMFNRLRGKEYSNNLGENNKNMLIELISKNKAHGALAYHDNKAVGWVAFDKKIDYAKIASNKKFQSDDDDMIWSITCFFIKKEYRKQGLANDLLAFAIEHLKKNSVKIIEAYPINFNNNIKKFASAFAWTGVKSTFLKNNFKEISTLTTQPKSSYSKVLMRLHI